MCILECREFEKPGWTNVRQRLSNRQYSFVSIIQTVAYSVLRITPLLSWTSFKQGKPRRSFGSHVAFANHEFENSRFRISTSSTKIHFKNYLIAHFKSWSSTLHSKQGQIRKPRVRSSFLDSRIREFENLRTLQKLEFDTAQQARSGPKTPGQI